MAHVKGWLIPGRHTESRAPRGGRCDETCVKPTPAQAHCTVCGCTFGGVRNFDRHRSNGWCLNPETLGLQLTDAGVWREPASERMKLHFEFETPTLPGL